MKTAKVTFSALVSLVLSFSLALPGARAQGRPEAQVPAKTESKPVPLFSTILPKSPERPRSYVFSPAISLFLPGFDQWYEGQYRSAAFFTGSGLLGLGLAAQAQTNLDAVGAVDRTDLTSRNVDIRNFMLGAQIYQAMGSFSAYTSFRSAVRSRQPLGQFTFLPLEENTGDLLAAPFEFSFLKRPTTYLPLLLAAGLVTASFSERGGNPFQNNSFTAADFAYGSAFSYFAGTHEEALFRGWIMPLYMESWDSPFWSNTVTSLLFALAHVNPANPVPWPQFALGWYLGHLTQKNGWSLGEAIFVHTWWDVIVFSAVYLDESRDRRPEAWFRMPLVQTTF